MHPMDIIGRYDGDAVFMVIIPEIALDEAENLAEQMKDWIKSFDFPHSKINSHLSISVGISCSQELESVEPAELIKLAEERLYKAKIDE
jgi:diguanylate cyclase (GGDEF)-like protein